MWSGDWSSFKEEIVKMLICSHHSEDSLKFLIDLSESQLMKIAWYARIRVLDPFLFCEPYHIDHLSYLAVEGSLLPSDKKYIKCHRKLDEETKDVIALCDTVAYHTTQVIKIFLIASCASCKDFKVNFKKKCEEFMESTLDKCGSLVENDEIFIMIRNHLPESTDAKMITSSFLITCIMCYEALKISDGDSISNFEKHCNNSFEVRDLKERGNHLYSNQRYDEALSCYTSAIKTNSHNHLLYGNRAQAYLKIGKGEEAEIDARRAVILNPDWVKGYYRLAQSLEVQGETQKAYSVSKYGIYKCKSTELSENEVYQELTLYSRDLYMKCTLLLQSHPILKDKEDKSAFVKEQNEMYHSEKNKKISNHQAYDVPELTDPSSSEDSDSSFKEDVCVKKDALQDYLQLKKEGSAAALAGCFDKAVTYFAKILEDFKKQKFFGLEEKELVSLKYSYGLVCIESCSFENILKGISSFTEILEDHKDVRCPAAYYGLGLAYFRMNNFKEALSPLMTGISVLKKGIKYTSQFWPATTNVISDTQPEKLKEVIENLITRCQHPPPPDAICRYKGCNQNANIYYSDPDFKGFIGIHCQEHCNLHYHPSCWKALKEEYNRTEKEFLDKSCLTPDCGSLIIHVEIINQNGTIAKQFPNESTKKCQRHRKSKLEKKMEHKELRKKKKIGSQITVRNSIHEIPDVIVIKESTSDIPNSNDLQDNETFPESTPAVNKITPKKQSHYYSDNCQPLYILKKQENQVNISRAAKCKEKKKPKVKNVMSIGEFCGDVQFSLYNEYQQRLNRLREAKEQVEKDYSWISFCETQQISLPQLDPDNPFYIPENLRENPEALETVLQSYSRTGESDATTSMMDDIFLYMESILKYEGPVHKDDPLLSKELSSFPDEAQHLINSCGGLINFLLQSMKFAVVKDYICVTSDVVKAYGLTSNISAQRYSQDAASASEEHYFSSGNNESDDNDCFFSSEEHGEKETEKYYSSEGTVIGLTSNSDFVKDTTLLNGNLYPHCSYYDPHYYSYNFLGDNYTGSESYLSNLHCGDGDKINLSEVTLNCSTNNEKFVSECPNVPDPQVDHSSNNLEIYLNKNHQEDATNHKINLYEENPCDMEETTWSSANDNDHENSAVEKFCHPSNPEFKYYPDGQNCMAVDLFPVVQKHHFTVAKSISNRTLILNKLEKFFKIMENNRTFNEKLFLPNSDVKFLPISKKDKIIQVDLHVSSVSVGVMKNDDELQSALGQIKDLNAVIEELQEKLDHARNDASTTDIKYKLELKIIKKNLQDAQSKFQKELNKLKTHQQDFDGERKMMQQIHSKIVEDLKMCQRELEKKSESLKIAENKSTILADINQGLQNEIKAEKIAKNELQETLHSVMKSCEDQCEKFISVQYELLNFKKREGLTQRDKAISYAEKNIKQLHNCLKDSGTILFFTPLIVQALKEWEDYKNDVITAFSSFEQTADREIYETGVTLDALNDLSIPSLPNPPLFPSLSVPSFLLPKMPLPDIHTASVQENESNKKFSAINTGFIQSNTNVDTIKVAPSYPPGLENISSQISNFSRVNDPKSNSEINTTSITFAENGENNISEKHNQTSLKEPGSAYALDDFDKLLHDSCSNLSTSPPLERLQDFKSTKEEFLNTSCVSTPKENFQSSSQQCAKSTKKVLSSLKKHFPYLTEEQFTSYLKIYRSKHQKLSGMTISCVTAGIKELVEGDYANQTGARPRQRSTSQIRKLTQLPSAFVRNDEIKNEKKEDTEHNAKAWTSIKTNSWSGEDNDGGCSICLEKITRQTAYRVDCKHVFHQECIREWLTKQSTCPICRVHTLLPEEFPSLG